LESTSGTARGRRYLEARELRLDPDPTVGAVQGPAYDALGLWDLKAHLDEDAQKPLLAAHEAKQQFNWKMFRQSEINGAMVTRRIVNTPGVLDQHNHNMSMDFDVETISDELRSELLMEGADLDPEEVYPYEETISSDDEF
jgi:hypothetical protein